MVLERPKDRSTVNLERFLGRLAPDGPLTFLTWRPTTAITPAPCCLPTGIQGTSSTCTFAHVVQTLSLMRSTTSLAGFVTSSASYQTSYNAMASSPSRTNSMTTSNNVSSALSPQLHEPKRRTGVLSAQGVSSRKRHVVCAAKLSCQLSCRLRFIKQLCTSTTGPPSSECTGSRRMRCSIHFWPDVMASLPTIESLSKHTFEHTAAKPSL